MKITLFILTFCSLSMTLRGQEPSVERAIFGTQVGWLGLWFYNELRISEELALRSELGLTGTCYHFVEDYHDGSWFFLTPSLSIEPRWYFNLKERDDKGKDITGNGASFISIWSSYIPKNVALTNNDNLVIPSQVSVIPSIGVKRNFENRFEYEVGGGLGYRYIFNKPKNQESKGEFTINILLRIGYKF